MGKIDFKDKWVVVTGASSGLGRAIARYLAKYEKANLVIAARRKERLEELKKELESAHGTKVEILTVDLSNSIDVDRLFQKAVERPIYGIVNNAGLTHYGKSEFANMDYYEKMIAVDFKALMHLSLRFLDYFLEKGEGAILNVTSLGAFSTMPYQNIYSACKHAAQTFTEGLNKEYADSNVVISSFAPGGIATEMNVISGLDKKFSLDSPFNMNADRVAKLAVKAFKKKKFLVVPGLLNKVTLFLLRLSSRNFSARAAERTYRPPT